MDLFKRYIALLLIFIGIALLWNTVVMYPLKIFVVFMHEVSHGLAAIATGGKIDYITIDKNEGGKAKTDGGSVFWILSAGYLGSLLWGGVILLLAARTRFSKAVSVLVGIGMVAITIGFGSDVFTYLFGIGFGVALILFGMFLPVIVNEWILKIIGVSSCLYAVLDIKSDVLDRPELESDAYMLSVTFRDLYLSTEMWGIIWIVIAIGLTFWFLYIAGKSPSSAKIENPDTTSINEV